MNALTVAAAAVAVFASGATALFEDEAGDHDWCELVTSGATSLCLFTAHNQMTRGVASHQPRFLRCSCFSLSVASAAAVAHQQTMPFIWTVGRLHLGRVGECDG
jgi:hypothetical protein